MKKMGFALLSFLLVFLFVNSGYSIVIGNECNYQIALYDSYGDGWSGNTLNVYVNGESVLSNITLASGTGPLYYSFSVQSGDEISTSYTVGGPWASEPYYYVIDSEGTAVASDGRDGGNNTIPVGLSGIIADCGNEGTIVIEKQTIPDGAAGDFTFTGDVTGTISDGGQIIVNSLSPGTYVSTETVPFGWALTSIVCDDANSTVDLNAGSVTFQLEAGETIVCTFTNTELDSDGDGVPDNDEGTGDRDGDGIPDNEDYDPTGYFYDELSGEIIPGGLIQVSGPGNVNVLQNGSNGFYQFTTDGTAGVYTISVTLPEGYEWSQSCLDQGVLDPTGNASPYVLGNGEDGNTGFLTSNACTNFYLQFALEQDDPFIFNNNFPMRVQSTAAIPTLSEWGMILMSLILAGSALWMIRRRQVS